MNAKKPVIRQSFVSQACLRENASISAFALMQPTGVGHSNPIREGGVALRAPRIASRGLTGLVNLAVYDSSVWQ
jgi:hypothetical protein